MLPRTKRIKTSIEYREKETRFENNSPGLALVMMNGFDEASNIECDPFHCVVCSTINAIDISQSLRN